jgi:membrane associated rhomboid family serine protease
MNEDIQAPEEDQRVNIRRYSSPVPVYTCVLIAGILAVFAAQALTGLDSSIYAAGFVKPEFARGQYWRILTGATVHAGILHVAMNSYAFYSFGKIFEILSNRAHLAVVFLLSAIGGGLLSLLFAPFAISVGASGGIVGLIGYLLIYAFRRRQFISPEFRKSLLINIGFIQLYGLALYQVIENYGHIGGRLTGAVYALVQVPGDPYTDPRDGSSLVQFAGIAALGLYLAACLFSILLIVNIV